jgi:GNAT superfamily N-acetyltransferase
LREAPMAVLFRTFDPAPTFGRDYSLLRDFLITLDSSNYHFGRWDWMITHSYLDTSGLPKIGLWLDNNTVIAAATFDCELGKAFLLALPGYEYLRGGMLDYAQDALAKDGRFSVLIPDGDLVFQTLAAERGFTATQDKECDAVYPLDSQVPPATLPDGFRITSMKENYDLFRYGQVLWKGFNHEQSGEGPFVYHGGFGGEFERPNVNLDLKIAVAAPGGDYVSYCGMWQDGRCKSALVEPVATDPAYRRMGLGRAAVLEGLRRCQALGAKRAFVGSSQQFYYSIGFRPYTTGTWWKRKE